MAKKNNKRRGGFARTQIGKTFYYKNQHTLEMLERFFNQTKILSVDEFAKLSWYDQEASHEFLSYTSVANKYARYKKLDNMGRRVFSDFPLPRDYFHAANINLEPHNPSDVGVVSYQSDKNV